jgi:hypothetical protein
LGRFEVRVRFPALAIVARLVLSRSLFAVQSWLSRRWTTDRVSAPALTSRSSSVGTVLDDRRVLLGADPRESATITAILVTALLGSGLLAGTVPAVTGNLSSGPVVAVLAALGALVGAWAARTRRGLLVAVAVPSALFAGVVLAGGLIATYGGDVSVTSRYLVAPAVVGLVVGTPVGVGGYGVAAVASRYADAE